MYVTGFILPAIFLISTGYVDSNATLAVFLITAGIALSGISSAAVSVNHLDLAPPYAGLYPVTFIGEFVYSLNKSDTGWAS